MNLKLTLLALLLANIQITHSMHITRCKMPSTEVLQKRLQGYKTFIQTTGIVEHLAAKELEPLEVVAVVEKAITDYHHDLIFEKKKNDIFSSRDLPHPTMHEYIARCKLTIIALVLKDYPEAVAHTRKMIMQQSAKL